VRIKSKSNSINLEDFIDKKPHFHTKNEIDNRYGHLVVIERANNDLFNNAMWLCRCDCGNYILTQGSSLRRGKVKSCGNRYIHKTGKKRSGNAPLLHLFRMYKNRAKKKNMVFSIPLEDFKKLIAKDCFYCGSKPSIHYAYHRTRYTTGIGTDEFVFGNGLDRINSRKGYSLSNCVPCCVICNRAKQNMSIEDFKKHILRICKNMNWYEVGGEK
jgi:5-methylcytosine-specific restriction endonuclease McrA